jgi:hypothetical protein
MLAYYSILGVESVLYQDLSYPGLQSVSWPISVYHGVESVFWPIRVESVSRPVVPWSGKCNWPVISWSGKYLGLLYLGVASVSWLRLLNPGVESVSRPIIVYLEWKVY